MGVDFFRGIFFRHTAVETAVWFFGVRGGHTFMRGFLTKK